MTKKSFQALLLVFTIVLLFSAPPVSGQNNVRTVTGAVRDRATGETMPGVTITLKGTNNRVATTEKGTYSIAVPNNQENVLMFSYLGFLTAEVAVKNQSVVNVSLTENKDLLNEVVVIGYGEEKRSDLTGSISSIKAEDLEKSKNTDMLGALQGKVAGVVINSQSGEPGTTLQVQIRGVSSLYGASTPLYVIDGVPFDFNNDEVVNTGPANIGYANNPLATLNPADIESIEVLKDASATAIYGSRGANGVILVTTKSGKAGNMQITYAGSLTRSQTAKKLGLLSGDEYIEYQRETRPTSPLFQQNGQPVDPYSFPQKDWQDEVLRTGASQNHFVGVSGGNNKTKYSGGVGFTDDEGIVIENAHKRYTFRLKLDHVQSNKLKMGLSANVGRSIFSGITNTGQANAFNGVVQQAIMAKPVIFYDSVNDDADEGFINPVDNIKNGYKNTTLTRSIFNGYVDYAFLKDFTYRLNTSVNLTNSKGKNFMGNKTMIGRIQNGIGSISESNTANWNVLNQITYQKRFNRKHRINAMVAFEASSYNFESFGASVSNFIDESAGIDDISRASVFSSATSNRYVNNRLSYLGRVNYSLLDKYLFTVSFRADGSDKFGSGNRYGYFPSAAFAWQLNREDFLKNIKQLSQLKFRLSYGATGNERIPPYSYYAEIAPTFYASNGASVYGVTSVSRANPELKWETTHQYNAGLDVGLFKNRISMNLDFYLKQTKDMLLPVVVAAQSGYTTQWKNAGQVDNKGLEFQLSTVNVQRQNFTWNTDFNISFNRNKIISLGNLPYIPIVFNNGIIPNIGRASIGGSIGQAYGYEKIGVYQVDDFTWQNNSDPTIPHESRTYELKPGIESVTGANVKPGSFKFRDISGPNGVPDGIIDEDYDRTVISSSLPKYSGGLGNTFTYKNLSLNFFLEYSYGGQLFNLGRMGMEGANATYNLSSTFWNNHWTPENPTNEYGAISGSGTTLVNQTARVSSSYYIEDASFLRLRTVTLNYSFSNNFIKKAGFAKVQVYLTGNNLHLWSKYSGYDPDVSYRDALFPGLDRVSYPRSRSYILGLNLTL